MEIANQIRQHRVEHGLSQDELAEAIFVSRQTVSNWENDKTYPDVQSILMLSELFSVSTDELIKGDVAAMQQKVADDRSAMKWLTIGMVILISGAILCFVVLSALWRTPSSIGNVAMGELVGLVLFAFFYILGMAAAIRVERIKSDNSLVTYREITAFYNGESVDARSSDSQDARHGFSRNHPHLSVLLKFVIGAAAGALVGIILYMLIW